MKLQIVATICLSAVALASPRYSRYSNRGRTSSATQPAIKIDSLDDAQRFAAQFYDKHGSEYQTHAQFVGKRVMAAFDAGESVEQRQKNVENVLINNAPKFGISAAEARELVGKKNEFLEDVISQVSITEVKEVLEDNLGEQINEGLKMIENDKLRAMAVDAKKTAVESLSAFGVNEKESVQKNFMNIWDFINQKFDVEGKVDEVLDEAEKLVKGKN